MWRAYYSRECWDPHPVSDSVVWSRPRKSVFVTALPGKAATGPGTTF